MSNNTFGHIFQVTTFGESHGPYVGGVIDGCPSGIEIDMGFIQQEMEKRKPGQSAITTSRQEEDRVVLISGVFEGTTTGAPVAFLIANKDAKPKDYEQMKNFFRPSHADYTYEMKYGIRDYRGGGRASARNTAPLVAAGAIAKLFLRKYGIQIFAYTYQIGHLSLNQKMENPDFLKRDENDVKCPDSETARKMKQYILKLKEEGDSIGGIVSCLVKNVPAGLGEPAFNKVESMLASAMMSIPASKGFEIGEGFKVAHLKGSENNDLLDFENGQLYYKTNHAGGVLGGISTGQDIYFNVAFKPASTIPKIEYLVDKEGHKAPLQKKGRHDPCIVPRAVAVVEAMTALVMADLILMNRASRA